MHKRQRTVGSKSMNQKAMKKMAGVLGFEPRDAEIKTRCLTAWRYPNWNSLIGNKEDFI